MAVISAILPFASLIISSGPGEAWNAVAANLLGPNAPALWHALQV